MRDVRDVRELRSLVQQRLAAAAEEIFGLFERTIAEYEEENRRQRRLLDAVRRTHTADGPRPLVWKEEVPPEQQEQTPSLDQEEPEPPPIKEEQEELWTNQEAEQLQDLTTFPVKSEDDEEEAPPSQPHQSSQLLSSHSSEPETEDSDEDWRETREPQAGSESQNELPENRTNTEESPVGRPAPNCAKEKVWVCAVCGKGLKRKGDFNRHMMRHRGEKPFGCSVCGKAFVVRANMLDHMRVHTGQRPYRCSVCGRGFSLNGNLQKHMRTHSNERLFGCRVCGRTFKHKKTAVKHMKLLSHTGEELYLPPAAQSCPAHQHEGSRPEEPHEPVCLTPTRPGNGERRSHT
uniref:C2H2-type domain-containing protein n=1 Tax=Myripristis murdjan TaxID=586833 RepID=A0A667XSS9_9TELE